MVLEIPTRIAVPMTPEIAVDSGLIPVSGLSIAYRPSVIKLQGDSPVGAISTPMTGIATISAPPVVSPVTDDADSLRSFSTALQEQTPKEPAPVLERLSDIPPHIEEKITAGAIAVPEPSKKERIQTLVDRSNLTFRQPKSRLPNPAILKNTLISAVEGKKHNAVEQLLDRGAPPSTGPEKVALIIAIRQQDMQSVQLLLDFGADPDEYDELKYLPLF